MRGPQSQGGGVVVFCTDRKRLRDVISYLFVTRVLLILAVCSSRGGVAIATAATMVLKDGDFGK